MPREDMPEELVETVARSIASARGDLWRLERNPKVRIMYGAEARTVLSAVSEDGWVRADDHDDERQRSDRRALQRDEARAHSEALAEALDELLIGGADAVSMEYAKRAAKVVLRSYRKARDA